MKTLERDRRNRRRANPNLEHLDDRIVPSTMHVAAGAGTEAVATQGYKNDRDTSVDLTVGEEAVGLGEIGIVALESAADFYGSC